MCADVNFINSIQISLVVAFIIKLFLVDYLGNSDGFLCLPVGIPINLVVGQRFLRGKLLIEVFLLTNLYLDIAVPYDASQLRKRLVIPRVVLFAFCMFLGIIVRFFGACKCNYFFSFNAKLPQYNSQQASTPLLALFEY